VKLGVTRTDLRLVSIGSDFFPFFAFGLDVCLHVLLAQQIFVHLVRVSHWIFYSRVCHFIKWTSHKFVDRAPLLKLHITIYANWRTLSIHFFIFSCLCLCVHELVVKGTILTSMSNCVSHPVDRKEISKACANVLPFNDSFFITVNGPGRNFLIWRCHDVNIHIIR